MRKKLGLALGSGGSRGVAHIGFLQALEEAGLRADYVTGCSMGAVVGACYAAGVSVEEMKKTVLGIRLSQIASLNVMPFNSNGLFRFTKGRKLLVEHIGEKSFDELEIPFSCVATDLLSGKLVELKQGNVADAVIASSSIPGAFIPAKIGEYHLVDGGVLERVPSSQVRKMGADVVVAVDVLGDLMQKKVAWNLVDTLLRCIDIMDTRATERKKNARKRSVDLWLEPDLGAMDQYKIKRRSLITAYEKGYELGKENIKKIKRLIEE